MKTRMQTVEMQLNGLTSNGVSTGVRSALECIQGVEQVSVVPNDPRVTIVYDACRARPGQFETAVRIMGCQVEALCTRNVHAAATERPAPGESWMSDRALN
jgi:cation transport ATPase